MCRSEKPENAPKRTGVTPEGGWPADEGTAEMGAGSEGPSGAMRDGSAERGGNDLTVHPEVMRLRERLASLSDETLSLLAREDDIRLQQNPYIEAEYAVRIGYLENELFAKQLEVRRARRRLALAQALANRGAGIGDAELAQIEVQLNAEFESWKARLSSAFERCAELARQHSGSRALSPADARELKRLYHALAKLLHPDLNPGLTPRERTLFLAVRSSYAAGDVDALRAIWSSVRGLGMGRQGSGLDAVLGEDGVLRELEAQVEAATRTRDRARERLEKLEREKPYVWAALLRDIAWVEQQKRRLRESMDGCDEALASYARKLSALGGGV